MKSVDANLLKQMLISGSNNLYNHYPEVDQLNVFPVPDGDTGMNMNLTATSGMKEIQNREFENVFEVAKCFSKGLLFGARGNSGVITSQIFRGFSNALEGKDEINSIELAQAFVNGKEVAYKAVLKPVEGTILTVIRESSLAMLENVKSSTSIEEAMEILIRNAKDSLDRTPELLPVLKEVGVVDSGGAGLCYILEGMALATKGIFVERRAISDDSTTENISPYAGAKLSEDEEGYGYCTQFILRIGSEEDGKKAFNEKTFQRFLASHGNSLVLVRDDDIVKVHVHTLTPGNMLTYAQQYGEFVSITIENMSEEHHNIEHGVKATDFEANIARGKEEKEKANASGNVVSMTPTGEEKEYGLIAVSSGDGLNEVFKELGVDQVVTGGQTMNPSTQDFITAINNINARNIFILPNNSNIVLAASQACDVLDGERSARVIPSKTIPQGIAALMQFNPEGNPDSVYDDMKSALKSVKSGSVTYAIKDTDIEGIHITKGFYMAMKDKNIISCVKDKMLALTDLVDSLVNDDSAILTIFMGEDILPEEESTIIDEITSKYGDYVDVDIRRGNQPVYSFIVGVE